MKAHSFATLLAICLIVVLPSTALPLPLTAASPVQDEEWKTTSLVGAPSARYGHTAIWTGSEVIVWGGYYYLDHFLQDGYKYDPVEDTWTAISTTNAPIGRLKHTAVWTGQKMIVWGGESGGGSKTTNTGGVYDPVTNSWTATSTTNAPSAREHHTAIWTGHEMIIWGGCSSTFCNQVFNNGGRYDPVTNTWAPIAAAAGLTPRQYHQAVWTGSRMIIWGGASEPEGWAYDPSTETWSPISTLNAPVPTFVGASVWTGQEMIVWGGCTTLGQGGSCPAYTGTGGRYNPGTNTWTPLNAQSAPTARFWHTAVWTGNRMIVWGGCGVGCYDTGAAYNPVSDEWTALTTTNAPAARGAHSAVWTGDTMTIWGGCTYRCSSYLNSGGRYRPEVPSTHASIQGIVWYDINGDGARDEHEPGLIGVAIKLLLGGLQIGQTTTAGDGRYAFTMLPSGLYQVVEVQPPWLTFSSTPNVVARTLAGGQEAIVDFGDWAGTPAWLPLILR